jgi:hypothetical protein
VALCLAEGFAAAIQREVGRGQGLPDRCCGRFLGQSARRIGRHRSSILDHLCELVGLRWEDGERIELHGIAHRAECIVPATIHGLDVYVREAGYQLTIPFCFAEGDAPLLLGRDGFFDAFRLTFDKPKLVTVFEPLDRRLTFCQCLLP